MRSITITDTESGQTYAGHLPTGWHEVPVSAFQQFARLQASRRPQLQLLSAVQALTDLPADVLEADVSLAANLALQLPWFFEAMPAGEPAPVLVHRGVTYEHQADFGRLTGGQFEALLAFLDTAEGNPGVAMANLLAVLLVRRGVKQDAKAVREAAASMVSLPMAQAWPYVAGFLKHSTAAALRTSACLLAQTQTQAALAQLEQLLNSGPKPTEGVLRRLCSGIAGGLARRYVRFARGRLKSF